MIVVVTLSGVEAVVTLSVWKRQQPHPSLRRPQLTRHSDDEGGGIPYYERLPLSRHFEGGTTGKSPAINDQLSFVLETD